NPSPSLGYVTKIIEIFPETNRIRIEIGETQGTFLVESIELICMED
ncbi:pesticidal protein, partial [Bacillus cereus]